MRPQLTYVTQGRKNHAVPYGTLVAYAPRARPYVPVLPKSYTALSPYGHLGYICAECAQKMGRCGPGVVSRWG